MTGILSRIADVAGDDAARRIADEFGGRRLYIPLRLPADHRLCRLVGFRAAQIIQREIGHGHLDVPLGTAPDAGVTRSTVARLTAEGMSARAIANELGCTMRTVYRHRAAR